MSQSIERFLEVKLVDREASEKAGKEVLRPVVHVEVVAGAFSRIVRPATDEDKRRDAKKYREFLTGHPQHAEAQVVAQVPELGEDVDRALFGDAPPVSAEDLEQVAAVDSDPGDEQA